MPDRSDLIAAALHRGDIESLAVASDTLLDAGDVRGRVISLELALRRERDQPAMETELVELYRANLASWLPPALADVAESSLELGLELESDATMRLHVAGGSLGFVAGFATEVATIFYDEDVACDLPVDIALDRDSFPFLQRLHLTGPRDDFATVAAKLAAHRREQLRALFITSHGRCEDNADIVDAGTCDAIATALPSLETLGVLGRRLLARLSHPTLVELSIAGCDAVGGIASGETAFPALQRFDFGFNSGWVLENLRDQDHDTLEAITAALASPGLAAARLDLSRNERGSSRPSNLGGSISVYELLSSVAVARKLAMLRLPSPRAREELEPLRVFLERAPDVRVEIARAYRDGPDLETIEHARLERPTPMPWPPADTQHGRAALSFCFHDERYGVDVGISGLVRYLEAGSSPLEADGRRIWTDFWDAVSTLGYESDDGSTPDFTFPVRDLIAGLEQVDWTPENRVAQLCNELESHRQCCDEADLRVHRYWGW